MIALLFRLFWGTCVLCLLVACADTLPQKQFGGRTMGTTYTVKMVGRYDDEVMAVIRKEVEATLEDINRSMSTYIADSELSRFNRSDSVEWYRVSPALHQVVREALRVSNISNGAFDVTVAPLVNLWGFGPEHVERAPSPQQLKQAIAQVGYRLLAIRDAPPALKKTHARVTADLSAIAKGYAVDALADVLSKYGVSDYLVEVGGELRVAGRTAKGERWRVGVEKPLSGGRMAFRILRMERGGIATSGDYRNYREYDGKRYSHELDPRTGYPVTHSTASVTVVAETAMTADALATALFVLGADAGLALAERMGIAAYFIERANDGEGGNGGEGGEGALISRHSTAMAPFIDGL